MKPKSIELLAFDKNHELQYIGKCKLQIDRLSSMLIVEPVNEEYKTIPATFKWNFVMDKNILFVFAENEINDFALIFDEKKRCKKVYNFICKTKAQRRVVREILCQRFLIPICKRLAENDKTTLKLKNILTNWSDSHDNDEKKEYIKFLKENSIFDMIFSLTRNEVNKNLEKNIDITEEHNLRKRSHPEEDSEHNSDKKILPIIKKEIFTRKRKISSLTFSKTVNLFKFVNKKSGVRMLRTLLIFISSQKLQCYEYFWNYKSQLYYCDGCKITAKVDNRIECVKLEDKEHVCIPLPYIAENYIEMKNIKKPDYEILENCNSYTGKVLIIFNKNDKNQCWEFRRKNNYTFNCFRCQAPAKLWNEYSENEYVELKNADHKCDFVSFNREKYYQFNDFVLSPDFEIRTTTTFDNKERKSLIIFDKIDRNVWYQYDLIKNTYYCIGCKNRKIKVSAKLLQNYDGQDYVLLSSKKHVCDLQSKFTEPPKMPTEVILQPPDFELMENTSNGIKKLFVFDSKDRNLCYVFSQRSHNNKYYCHGCYHTKYSNKNQNATKVFGLLCQDENGENFLQLNSSKHICKPQKYEPEKYVGKTEIQPKCYDYFFFRPKNRRNSINVAFYHPENKRLCFKFLFIKKYAYFTCSGCNKKRKHYSTRIEKDENGIEYFRHDLEKHICQPIKVSSIRGPEFVILKRNKINLEKKISKGCRIVEASNFEIRPNNRGIPDASLIIFCSKDRNFGYQFYCRIYRNSYYCKQPFCRATAKLQIGENGEKKLIFGKNEHQCEPIKFEDFKRINASDFVKVCQNEKIIKIVVFATSDRAECFEYNTTQKKNIYKCMGCFLMHKSVTVKLHKNENDGEEEYLQISKQEYICQPRKYIKEKYIQPKLISNELIEFHSNSKGEEKKKLIIFTSDKKDFVYEYYLTYKDTYLCVSCLSKYNKSISVKIIQDKNGQYFVKPGLKEHVCQPLKYNPKKYIYSETKIISNNFFVFCDGKNGEKDKYIILFTSEKKEFAYLYFWRKSGGHYLCYGCNNLKRCISAKIITNSDESRSLQLSKNEHICEPQKCEE